MLRGLESLFLLLQDRTQPEVCFSVCGVHGDKLAIGGGRFVVPAILPQDRAQAKAGLEITGVCLQCTAVTICRFTIALSVSQQIAEIKPCFSKTGIEPHRFMVAL